VRQLKDLGLVPGTVLTVDRKEGPHEGPGNRAVLDHDPGRGRVLPLDHAPAAGHAQGGPAGQPLRPALGTDEGHLHPGPGPEAAAEGQVRRHLPHPDLLRVLCAEPTLAGAHRRGALPGLPHDRGPGWLRPGLSGHQGCVRGAGAPGPGSVRLPTPGDEALAPGEFDGCLGHPEPHRRPHGHGSAGGWRFRGHASSHLGLLVTGGDPGRRMVGRTEPGRHACPLQDHVVAAPGDPLHLRQLPALLQALPRVHLGLQHLLPRPGAQQEPQAHGHGGRTLRHQQDPGFHLEADARLLHLRGVWPLSGELPHHAHRQAAPAPELRQRPARLPEGHAPRPDGPGPARARGSPTHRRPGARGLRMEARRGARALEQGAARGLDQPGHHLGLHQLRLLRVGLPPADHLRGQARGHAALPHPGGEQLPRGSPDCLQGHGAPGQPLEFRASGPRPLGRGSRRAHHG